jgi:hypothetical protein
VKTVVSELYPNRASKQEVLGALALLEKKRGANLLEEIRRLLLISIIKMDDLHNADPVDLDEESLVALIDRWEREVEEILVHVFDFVYFYGRDPDAYVVGIWTSWGTIPNISNRIRDYVVRTISTVFAVHLARKSGEEASRNQVRRALKALQADNPNDGYIKTAIKYIDKHWDDEIRSQISARRHLVRIARSFLFSEKIATALRTESEISGRSGEKGRAGEKEGYTLKQGQLELRQIRNPLHFLELYTSSKFPSPAGSLWIFYVLAFCVQGK